MTPTARSLKLVHRYDPILKIARGARTEAICGLLLFVTFAAPAASALTINFIPANSMTDHPTFDPDLGKLMAIVEAAGDYWEGIILDNHTLDIEFGYLDLEPAVLGISEVHAADGAGRPTQGAIALDTTVNSQTEGDFERNWFFDSTPLNNSEFNMQQVLVRDIDDSVLGAYYNDSPPDLLEAGYWGTYSSANLGDDAWTVALHEIGHILGVTNTLPNSDDELMDGDYDFNPNFVNGAIAAAKYWDVPEDVQPEHLRSPHALMSVGAGSGDRHLPGATDVFAAAAVAEWGSIDLYRKDFLGGTVWNLPMNWEGNRLPTGDESEHVYIRHGGNVSIILDATAGNLTVRDGSSVHTNENRLDVLNGTVTVEAGPGGSEASLIVDHQGELESSQLIINDGGRVFVSDLTHYMPAEVIPHRIRAHIHINPGGALIGNGSVDGQCCFGSDMVEIINDGTITAIKPSEDDDIVALALTTGGSGFIDLDGSGEMGKVFAVLGSISVTSPLNDPFDGEMTVGAGRWVDFQPPWELGDGVVNLQGGDDAANAAAINAVIGEEMTANGEINVTGWGEINTEVIFQENATVNVEEDAVFALNERNEFNGGSYTGLGTIRFNGETVINSSTTIDVAHADLDGQGVVPQDMTIDGAIFTLNVDRIDSLGQPNQFDAVMHISGGELDVRLNNPDAFWTMDGTMNLNGRSLPSLFPELAGSDIHVTGTINADGAVSVTANLVVQGEIATVDSSSEFHFRSGHHIIRNTATVHGPGTLVVRSPASLQLQDETTIAVDMEISGRLEPGTSIGQAIVEGDVEMSSLATFAVELAGNDFEDFDTLSVVGAVVADGTLEVSLIDGFMPTAGSAFTVLTGETVSGMFDEVETFTDGFYDFDVNVQYGVDRVILEVLELFLPGDYNDDGVVNAVDYVVWRKNLGAPAGSLPHDVDGGPIGQAQYDTWVSHFGDVFPSPGASAASQVPEPESGVLLILILASFTTWGRNRLESR